MEGDAGASSRLNPTDDNSSFLEVTTEDSTESEVGADQTNTAVTTEDSTESEVGADQTNTAVTTEASTKSEASADETPEDGTDETAEVPSSEDEAGRDAAIERPASRLGLRRWVIGVAAALLLAAGGVGYGGWLALHSHQKSRAIERDDAAAIKAAQDCVAAMQAPDTNAMSAAALKMVECTTGDFGAKAALFGGVLADAYRVANAHVEVADMRSAVESNRPDRSVVVLVALRTKVSNSEAQNREQGYRLRVTMTRADGQYKVSKLDQVAK